MNLPTYLNSEEPEPEIMHVLIQNKAAHTLILERFPNSRLAIKLRGSLPSIENNLNPEQSKQQQVTSLFRNQKIMLDEMTY